MIGWIRAAVALSLLVLVSPPMLLLQYLAVRFGVIDDRILPQVWHRLALGVLGIRLHVHGRISERRPLLLAGNHVSWTDIVVAGAAGPVNFIAKSEIANWPIASTFAYLQRSVFVERDRRGRSGSQASEISRRLIAGDAMFLFAEGTTSDGNILLPFKSTLFGAASMVVDTGAVESVAIQPVAIVYTRFHGMPMNRQHRFRYSWIGQSSLLPHLMALIREGGVDVEVHFGEPVEYGAGSSRKAVAREVERRVRHIFVHTLRAPRPSRG
jgi:lyso-ornithine lipid O-acyltransferase